MVMDQLLYRVIPDILLLLFGSLLGVWGVSIRRSDLSLESMAVYLGRVGAAMFLIWMVALTVYQRQVPVLNPGQLAFFLGGLVWFGQCYAQQRINQRLFVVLPLLGVVILMVFGLVLGMRPGPVTTSLKSVSTAIHVTMSLAGIALLLGCGVFGAGHVILDLNIRRRNFNAWFQRLPSLGEMDSLRRLTLITGWALVTASLVSALVILNLRSSDQGSVASHLHPMVLLATILTVLVLADRFRWISANKLAIGCMIMSLTVVILICVSVIEIFYGRIT